MTTDQIQLTPPTRAQRPLRLAVVVGAVLVAFGAGPAFARSTTTTTLALSTTVAGPGETVTLTATVTAGVGIPAGTIKFSTPAGPVGPTAGVSVTPVAGSTNTAQATLDTAFTPGVYVITASFSPTDIFGFSGSSSAPQTLTVSQNTLFNTQTTLTASPTTIQTGQPVTLTATVVQLGVPGIPTGTVSFTEGGVRLGEGTLDATGVATLTVPSFLAGTHVILASYLGTIFDKASSATITLNATDSEASKVQTTTHITVSPSTIRAGDTVTISATVVQTGTTTPPQGDNSVEFTADGVRLGDAPLVNGVATLTHSGWIDHVLPYDVKASYFGNVYARGSSDDMPLTVLPPIERLTSTLDYTGDTSGAHGTTATLSAVLTNSEQALLADEDITFTLGAESCTVQTDANGVASCTVTIADPVGTHEIDVAFGGDLSTLGTTTSATYTVLAASTTLAVAYVPGGTTSQLSGTLRDGSGNPIAGRTVTLSLGGGGSNCSAVTDAAGVATCGVTTPPGSTALLAADFAGDDSYQPSHDDRTVALQVPTTLSYRGALTGNYDDVATLAATLTATGGAPLAAQSVTLTAGSQSCTATTGNDGVGSCPVVVSDPAGSYPVTATFAGAGLYLPSTAHDTFVVTPEQVTVSVGTASTALAGPVALTGTLLEDGVTPIAGNTLTLSLGAVSCQATTNAAGIATCTVQSGDTLGPLPTGASFGGDASYLPGSASGSTLVFAFAPGGWFAVGDRSATATATVTFWGSQWWKLNVLSGGAAPSSFKGYTKASAPRCGSTWSTDPGNSTPPPAGPLPAYMGVVVTSAAAKSGSAISGTVTHIVVVQTVPGYDANPGHPSTGSVVTIVC